MQSHQSICRKMVARIKRTQSFSRSLNYNEKKVQTGAAECIHAANYPKDLEAPNFYDKLHRLEHQTALNERVKANSVHISLNFHESDQFNKEKLFLNRIFKFILQYPAPDNYLDRCFIEA